MEKSEIRNPKLETNSNDQKRKHESDPADRNNFKTMNDKTDTIFQTGGTGIGVLNFLSLGFIWLRFVSNFDIRISDFISEMSWRDKF